jgi:rhodanese-related sulfurtransferase
MSLLSVSYAAAPENFAKLRDAKLAEARKAVKEVTAAEVKAMADKGESFVMLDIREENEQGIVIGVGELKKLPRGLLEWTAPAQLDENDKIVVYCKTGARSGLSSQYIHWSDPAGRL